MRESIQKIRNHVRPWHARYTVAALLIAWSALLIQCTDRPAEAPKSTSAALQTTTREGYILERFATPEQQLQYTRTGLIDPGQKRAALELLIELFPEAKTIRAEAELELAYLSLGGDYRFADPAACRRAIERYEQVLSQYADLPSVCAKARWYMGWINADLLNQKRRAIAHYQDIVENYPDAILSMKPPVPWAELVLPQALEKPVAVYEYPSYKWSSIALLEIIRNSEDENEKWTAFEKLWTSDRASMAMGYALRDLVYDSPALARKVVARAGIYLDAQLFSQPIAEEVRMALKSLKAGEDAFSDQGARKTQ